MLLSDGLIHLPGDAVIAEMARDSRAKFSDIECLGKVHLEHGAAACGKRETVLSGLCALRYATVTEVTIGCVRGAYGLCVDSFQLGFQERGLAGADRLLIAVNVGVGLAELDAAAVAVHVAEATNIHKDVEAEAVTCAESPQKLVVASAMLRPQPDK